jgi:hypothetical protein
MGGACSTDGEMRIAYSILIGRPEWKRLLGTPRSGRKDNIRLGLREIEWEDMDWLHLE